jgi:hypothetical protein
MMQPPIPPMKPPMPPGAMVPQPPWPMQPSRCQACHRVAPTKQVTFRQNIGAIILRFPKTIRGSLCKRCIDKYFWEMTTITFFLGWWGVISFFYTLFSIPQNVAQFIGSRSLPDA